MAEASVERHLPRTDSLPVSDAHCSCRSEEVRVVVFKCHDRTTRGASPCIPTVGEEIAKGVWIWISVCECQSSCRQ